MADITKEQVLETLKTVRGPDLEHNIVELGMVSDVFISDGKVYFSITVPAERAKDLELTGLQPSVSSRICVASKARW